MDQPILGGKRKGKQRMFGGGERKGTLFFLQLHGAEQERITSGTVLCFFQGSLCLWLLAQTSPTQEEEKQSYEIGWPLRLLQSNDKEEDAGNAVVLKWYFQRLHKGEKGKAGDGLNNCLSALWTFQVGRKSHGWIPLQGNQASKWFCRGIPTSSCKHLPHLLGEKKKSYL